MSAPMSKLCLVLAAVLVLSASGARASLLRDALECIDGRAFRNEPRCQAVRDESVESVYTADALVEAMVQRKEFSKALVILDLAARRYPLVDRYRSRQAEVRSYAQEVEAIDARQRARAQTSSNQDVDASMMRIRCTRLSGDAGLAACEAALKREPANPALLAAKGDLLAADGRLPEAIETYSSALQRQPGDLLLRQKIALLSGRRDRPVGLVVPGTAAGGSSVESAGPAAASTAPIQGIAGSTPASGSPTSAPAPGPSQGDGSVEQRLVTLQRLFSTGLLSEIEFASRRKALLDQLVGSGVPAPQPVAGSSASPSDRLPPIEFGRYYAIVIGIDRYRHLPVLETARFDAQAVAAVLRDKYDFEVKLLLDPAREQVIESLDEARERLTENDNLLIYFAGHGWLDKEAEQGFWLPIDARAERRSQWISNDTIRDFARALKAKHMLVISDSCFSGTLTRGISAKSSVDGDYLRRISNKRARQAISSGGLEPVADSIDGKHSPFARALIQVLSDNRGVLDGVGLFNEIRRPVSVSADQTPEFSDIRRAGHDGGDFLFVRRR